MDTAPELLERLDRVADLDRRRRAASEFDLVLLGELLGELRALVDGAGVAASPPADGGEVVERPARRLQGT